MDIIQYKVEEMESSVFNQPRLSVYDSLLINKNNNYDLVSLISLITSSNEIDYQLIGDFFLTYRSFICPQSLLKILILRLNWCIQQASDLSHEKLQNIGKLTLIRTFVTIRHWLLNYFNEDFLNSKDLRLIFINSINLIKSDDLFIQRIISNLKKLWTDCCNKFWDENVTSTDFYNFTIKIGPQDNKYKRLSSFALNHQSNPIVRNSLVLSIFDPNKIHKLPLPKKQPNVLINPKNSNLRLSYKNFDSNLYTSLNSKFNPGLRNIIRDSTEFPNSSTLSKILPSTPVKKMDIVLNLPTESNKEIEKGLKPLIEKWLNTFKKNNEIDNNNAKSNHAEKFVKNVVSFPKINSDILNDLLINKFDILSARTIDELEYLIRFHNEIISQHGIKLGLNNATESFNFIRNDNSTNNKISNIDNLNICETISFISKSVISLNKLNDENNSFISYNSSNFENHEKVINEDDLLKKKKAVNNLREFNFENDLNRIPSSIISESTPNEIELSPDNSLKVNKNLVDAAENLVKIKSIEKPKPLSIQSNTNLNDDDDIPPRSPDRLINKLKINSNDDIISNHSSDSFEVDDIIVNREKEMNENNTEDDIKDEFTEVKEEALPEVVQKVIPDLISPSVQELVQDLKASGIEQELQVTTPNKVSAFDIEKEDIQVDTSVNADLQNEVNSSVPLNEAPKIKGNEFHFEPPTVELNSPNPTDSMSPNKVTETVPRFSKQSISSSRYEDAESLHTFYEEPQEMEQIDETLDNNNSDTSNGAATPPQDANLDGLISSTPNISPIKPINELDLYENNNDSIIKSKLDLNKPTSFRRVSNHSVLSRQSEIKVVNNNTRISYLSKRSHKITLSEGSTNSIFSEISKNQKILNVSITQEENDLDLTNSETKIQSIQSKDTKSISLIDSMNSENYLIPYPGVNSQVMAELAGITDDSIPEDPITAALLKLEGNYKKKSKRIEIKRETDVKNEDSNESSVDSELLRKVESLTIQSLPSTPSKRNSKFIDQRRKTKLFALTPVKQKDISHDISSSRVLMELLLSRKNENELLSISNSKQHVSFILNFDSKSLAEQFTLIEKDCLLEIDWKELVDFKWDSNNLLPINSWLELLIQNDEIHGIDLCISRFNLTVNWIISEILLTKDITLRTLTIQRFIHIAQNCKKLQNYSTLMQILLALGSDKVMKLKETWRVVEPGDILIYKNLESIASPLKNFLNLRTEINKLKPSLGCIPFLGLYLSDLIFNKEKKSIIDNKINFGKFMHDSKIVRSLIQCIQWSILYKIEPNDEILSKCLYIKSLAEEEMNECLEGIN